MSEMRDWLASIGLDRYVGAFQENDIEADLLPELTDEFLQVIGITSVGHRLRLLKAIRMLSPPSEVSSALVPNATVSPARDQAERRQLTVMFADLVGSTELSIRLDPEDLRDVNRAFQDAAKRSIDVYGGYVARYMGDGVLAYFGFPVAHEDDAERAIRSSLALIEEVSKLRFEYSLSVRIGVATGSVVVGDVIGEEASQESAVVGETPNLASRLQALAAADSVVISEGTRRLLPAHVSVEPLGDHSIRGFPTQVRVYGVTDVAERSPRATDVPLTGRDEELALLLKRWEQAKSGEGQVVLLVGEPGVGKSRLAEALQEKVESDCGVISSYYCSPFYTQTALHPVSEQLKLEFRFDRDDGIDTRLGKVEKGIDELGLTPSELAPHLSNVLGLARPAQAPHSGVDPQEFRRLTLRALLRVLEARARRTPLLVIAEDLHWVDATTLEFLTELTECARSNRMLILLTSRPEFAPPWGLAPHVTAHTLNGLTRADCRHLVFDIAGQNALPRNVIEEILGKSDGVPLFVEELTKAVVESSLPDGDGGFPARQGVAFGIPSTLQDSLLARLDRLGDAKDIAQLAAVFGRKFNRDQLEVVSDYSSETLQQALDTLVSIGLTYRSRSGDGEQFEFKHALVRDAAYESLLRQTRRTYHLRIAAALSEQFSELAAEQPEVLAQHYTLGEDFSLAIQCWLKAARRGNSSSNYQEALSSVAAGLGLLPHIASGPERDEAEADLQLERALALIPTKGYTAEEMGAAALQMSEAGRRLGDDRRVFWGLWQYAPHLRLRGDASGALDIGNELVRLAGSLRDADLILAAKASLGTSLYYEGELLRSKELLKEALTASSGGDGGFLQHHTECHNLRALALTLGALGFLDQAVDTAKLQMDRANAWNSRSLKGVALMTELHVRAVREEHELTRSLSEQLLSLGSDNDFPFMRAMASSYLGWAIASLGDIEQGISHMREAMEDQTRIVSRTSVSRISGPRFGVMLARQGFHDEVDAQFRSAREFEQGYPQILFYHGEAKRLLGERALAEELFERTLEITRRKSIRTWELAAAISLAELRREDGRVREAVAVLHPVFEWFTEGLDTPLVRRAESLLRRLT